MNNQTAFDFTNDMQLIAGVDEAGRGPLAGAVYAAAVILDKDNPISGLTDSKKLSAKKRALLEGEIKLNALAWFVASASVEEIDDINILQASMLAMKRAVEGLDMEPNHVLIDGNRCPQIAYSVEAIVKGDLTEPSISAASILAKEARDRELLVLDKEYPGYGFANHKGYGTKQHMESLLRLGPTPVHRTSFRPVRELL